MANRTFVDCAKGSLSASIYANVATGAAIQRVGGKSMFALTVMRAFAIFAITNSHLRELHPYSFLATGGVLGNTVFFFISGFGITLGILKTLESLRSWYQRRLFRIYEPLIILTVFFVLIGYKNFTNLADAIRLFVYPFEYWFIPAIAIFYVPAYLFARHGTKPLFIASFIGLGATYLALYLTLVDLNKWNVEDHIPVKSIFYFFAMLCGVYIAKFYDISVPSGRGFYRLVISTVIFFSIIIIIQRFSLFKLQAFIEIFALFWTFSFYLMLRNNINTEWIKSRAYLVTAIEFISAITLQMYLVQEAIFSRPVLKSIPYPANIVLVFAAVIVAAWMLSKISLLPLIVRRNWQSNA